MSYLVLVEGGLRIDPPLNYREVRQWPEVLKEAGSRNGWAPVRMEQLSEQTVTDEGTHTIITCAEVVPFSEERFSGVGNLPRYVAAMLDTYGKAHRISGYFECLGEDGRRWRVGVDSEGELFQHEPEYVWPEIP